MLISTLATPAGGRHARTVSGCLNSAFSRHFYTFYEPSVQAMDTQLNSRQNFLSWRLNRFWLLELRVCTFVDNLRPKDGANPRERGSPRPCWVVTTLSGLVQEPGHETETGLRTRPEGAAVVGCVEFSTTHLPVRTGTAQGSTAEHRLQRTIWAAIRRVR